MKVLRAIVTPFFVSAAVRFYLLCRTCEVQQGIGAASSGRASARVSKHAVPDRPARPGVSQHFRHPFDPFPLQARLAQNRPDGRQMAICRRTARLCTPGRANGLDGMRAAECFDQLYRMKQAITGWIKNVIR